MNLLQQGLAAHQQKNYDVAESCYLSYLKQRPHDFSALQLLGALRAAQGNVKEAITLCRKSLKIQPKQPNVHNNLANYLKQSGLTDDAQQHYRAALALKSDYHDARKNLIKLLIEQSAFDVANKELVTAQAAGLPQVDVVRLQARCCTSENKLDEAITLYERAIQLGDNQPQTWHDLALALRTNGQPAKALDYYQALLKAGVNDYALFHNVANAYSDLGKLEQAIGYYQQAIALQPQYVDAHINLSELMWEVGKPEHMFDEFRTAIAQYPDDLELRVAYIDRLLRLKHLDTAWQEIQSLGANFSQFTAYQDVRARLLKARGEMDSAVQAHKRVLNAGDSTVQQRTNAAETLMQNGNYTDALRAIEAQLSTNSHDQMLLSLRDLCWRALGMNHDIINSAHDNLVREYYIEIPPEFPSRVAFCNTLADYLTSLHTGTQQPLQQTLHGGTQTRGNLFDNPHPLIQQVIAAFRQCINRYIDDIQHLDEPYPGFKQVSDYRFSGSWSVRLKKSGYHNNHVHPMGWLSSAFYVQLPSVTAGQDRQGWFKVGEPNIALNPPLPALRYVQPEVGKLVLFPSYIWHGTQPFDSDEVRTTIAYDVEKII
ncbi:tetratricopeptide repeat protein [Aestuariibacter salexigens]|uniref:tetratricopeptide repeat protein n=1 Tax=Aestuariibacter salexigens TaxID=226010 RepID=UPI0003F919A3|nr:tetratricopeptide repeat protein [Aestuariibacter salexigens]